MLPSRLTSPKVVAYVLTSRVGVGYDREGSIKVCNTRKLLSMSDWAHTNRLRSSVRCDLLSDGRGIVRLLSGLAASRQAVNQLSRSSSLCLRRSRGVGKTYAGCISIVFGFSRVKETLCAASNCFCWGMGCLMEGMEVFGVAALDGASGALLKGGSR